MPIDVRNDVLIRCQIPGDRASLGTIMKFALTIDGYRALGPERLAKVANMCRASGRLPDDLTALRACLFYEQRSLRHLEQAPSAKDMRHIRALVRAIRRRVLARGRQR